MKKENPQIRWHLSEAEKEQIRTLSNEGLSATAIAAKLDLTLNTVIKWKKAMGLPIWPALPEKEILELLRKSIAPRTIAQRLRISYRRTRTFAHRNGFGRPRKVLSPKQSFELIRDILGRRGSAAALAKKHHASYKTVLEMAHTLLACVRFLPSWRTPLASYFPSLPTRPMKTEDAKMSEAETFVGIVTKIAEVCDGKLPQNRVEFVALLVDYFCIPENVPPQFRDTITLEEFELVRANFAANLVMAVDIYERDRKSAYRN